MDMNATRTTEAKVTDQIACPTCKGTKTIVRLGYGSTSERPCFDCGGIGHFLPPVPQEVVFHVLVRKGPNRGKLLRSRPTTGGPRSYYVWRMARFHGGADVCMPVVAMMELGADPFRPVLDEMSEALAKVCFGTNMAAASRWAPLLGIQSNLPAGLPASAYEGGPAGTDIGDNSTSPEFHHPKT